MENGEWRGVSPYQVRGRLVTPGMTNCLRHMSLSCKPQFSLRLACPEDANRFWFDRLTTGFDKSVMSFVEGLRTNGWHIDRLMANGKCREVLDALL